MMLFLFGILSGCLLGYVWAVFGPFGRELARRAYSKGWDAGDEAGETRAIGWLS